jgi:hypothetical protein
MMAPPNTQPDVVIASSGCSPYAFGAAMAAHRDEVLVGAPYRYYSARAEEGIPPPSACLLRRASGRWSAVETLTADDPAAAGGFGRTVLLGPSFAVVGAPGYENGDGPTYDFGRAASTHFALRAKLDSPERGGPHEDVFAEYGVAIAGDERTLLIGAPLGVTAQP